MDDWEINPDAYQKDSDGNFVLKKDGTPKKRSGRAKGSKSRGYNYHSTTKKKIEARRAVRLKEKRLEKTRSKLNAYKTSLSASKETLAKLDNSESSTKGKIITEDNVVALPKKL